MNITHGQIIASSCLLFIRHTHVFGACWHSKCALSVCLPMHVTQKFSRWISVYSRKNKNTNGNTAAVDEKIIYLFLTRHRTRSFVCSFIVIIIIFFFFVALLVDESSARFGRFIYTQTRCQMGFVLCVFGKHFTTDGWWCEYICEFVCDLLAAGTRAAWDEQYEPLCVWRVNSYDSVVCSGAIKNMYYIYIHFIEHFTYRFNPCTHFQIATIHPTHIPSAREATHTQPHWHILCTVGGRMGAVGLSSFSFMYNSGAQPN